MGGIEGWMGKKPRAWLAEQARTHRMIIEVGVWKGRSTRVLADNTRGRVYAVDHWRGTPTDPAQHRLYQHETDADAVYRAFCANLSDAIDAGRVHPVRMDSTAAAAFLLEHVGRAFDFVFIDADHSYDAVRADIAAYRRLLVPGGLLSGHDYAENWPGVRRAVDDAGLRVRVGPSTIWSARVP